MAQLDQLPGPVVRPRAGLNANQRRGQVGKEGQNLRPLQLLKQHLLASAIHTVHLNRVNVFYPAIITLSRDCIESWTVAPE
jgi:hypothetical protein